MRVHKIEGFIYKTKHLQERDKLVWILSNTNGKVTAVAKGVKKITSKRAGHIDIFNYNQFQLYKGNGLDIITDTRIIDSYPTAKKFNPFVFLQLAEVIDKVALDELDSSRLLNTLTKELNDVTCDTLYIRIFKIYLELLRMLGFEPLFNHFLNGEILTEKSKIYFELYTPGFSPQGSESQRVLSTTFKCLKFIQKHITHEAEKLNISQNVLEEMDHILLTWVKNMFDLQIKSKTLLHNHFAI